jgi:prefoldin subunit 5
MVRARFVGMCLALVTVTGCGAGAVFESEEVRRARVDVAVANALSRERGWQTRFVERRTDTMRADQSALRDRLAELERKAETISGRVDEIQRAAPDTAGYVETETTRAAADTRLSEMAAEIDSIQRDITAITGAVAKLTTNDRQGEAVTRARLERLEWRTRELRWPSPSSPAKAVHLASYRSHEAALAGWEVLMRRHRDILGPQTPTLIAVRTVAGEYIRLFTGAGLDQTDLVSIQEAMRDSGNYAMILPLPGGPKS